MRTLYLVRHGQASFGSHNYDQLSPIGQQQSILLGQYFAKSGLQFDTVLCGSLQRHHQTWHGIAQGLASSYSVQTDAALNEYDSDAIIQALPAAEREPWQLPDKQAASKAYFRNLRTGLDRWMAGSTQPVGMPSYAEFTHNLVQVLEQVQQSSARSVLIVSSGGVITTAIGHILGLNAAARIDLNMQLRNSAVSEIQLTSRRMLLHSFNTLPHLDPSQHGAYQTYA